MNDITLRRAVQADTLTLSMLATQVFLDTYATEGIRPSVAREVQVQLGPAAIDALLARPDTCLIVAERAQHLIGFVQSTAGAQHVLVPQRPAVELDRLYVQEPFTGRGLGKALLSQAQAHAAAQGAAVLWLTCWVRNTRALAFYARQGYAELGSTDYEFEGERHENRVFAKTLPRAANLRAAG
jgi:ribosomal protein S18 acetylase RimI-like enzyme